MRRKAVDGTSRGPASGLAFLLLVLLGAVGTGASRQPPQQQQQRAFFPAATATAAAAAPAAAVHRRQECIANFYSCANQGGPAFNGVCCANGQLCAVDASGQPACCPAGAVCTGVAPPNFVPPATTAPVSFVPNNYFPFAYITTSFANPAACSAAVDQCNRNRDTCQQQLQGAGGPGGVYGVTIVVPGGGGTVVGATRQPSLAPAAATSICVGLSSAACFGIQPTVCSSRGLVNGVFYVGSANPAPARPTPPPPALALVHIVAAVGLGVVAAL